jgi:hypothetical protein
MNEKKGTQMRKKVPIDSKTKNKNLSNITQKWVCKGAAY